jgi:lysophospholipase L1-like esterase
MSWQHFVALGDSLTAGVGDEVPGIETCGWADRFAEALRPTHYTNLAKRGATTDEILTTQVEAALAHNPDIVSLLAGGNDMRQPDWNPERTRENLRAIMLPFAERGVALLTFTMGDIFPAFPAEQRMMFRQTQALLHRVNDLMREVSREVGAILVDLQNAPEVADLSIISADMIHPNMLGYQRIAQLAIAQVMELGLRRGQVA